MKNKKLIVVARYQENIDWINNISGDVTIYNKGKDFPWDFARKDLDNYGREAETYVRAILDFYNDLHKYERVCFVQGNPFDHSKQIYTKLELEHDEPVFYLGDNTQSVYTGVEACICESSFYIVDLFFKEIVKNTVVESERQNFATDNLSKINFDLKERDGSKENRVGELIEILCLCEIMRIPYKSANYKWDCGAQYSVKTEYILNKSFDWWKSLYNLIHHSCQTLNLNVIAYILERTWPLIWNHKEKGL